MFSTVCLCIILIFHNVHTFTVGVTPMNNREMIVHSRESTPLPHYNIETTPQWTCFDQVLCEMMEWWPWQKLYS